MTRPAAPRLATGLLAATAGLGTALLPVAHGPAVAAPPAPGAVASASPAAAPAAAPTDPRTPLRVTIASLAPATVPSSGRVTVTGEVTNRSDETWTDLNVYLVTSSTPITSRSGLAEAAATSPDTPVGERRAAEGQYVTINDLLPGGTASYRLSLRRADLAITGGPGVYWIGVHVLGATDGERDSLADGRARTFLPLLPEPGSAGAARARTSLALVVPVRQPVRRGGAARLLGVSTWERELAPNGRLARLLAWSGTTRRPLTWVVDPAVLDAVASVALGNPPLDTAPAPAEDEPDAAPQTPGSSAAGGGAPPEDGGAGAEGDAAEEGETGDDPSPAVARARAWLEEFRRQAPTHTVASLPYGDLDVSAALGDRRPELMARALRLGAATLAGHGIERAVPVVAPSSGYLSPVALQGVGAQAAVLLADSALPSAGTTVVRRPGHPPVVLADTAAGSGGPRPHPRFTALAVRQRLLGEAALRALSPDRAQPLVVSLPGDWDPGSGWQSAGFFAALDRPWLRLVDLPGVTAGSSGRPAGPVAGSDDEEAVADELVYPPEEQVAEVPAGNLAATAALTLTGRAFATLLTGPDAVEDAVARVALLGSSTSARADPDRARGTTRRAGGYLRSQMSQVHIVGPRFVMMSGVSGPIQLTLVNDLERTVTVGLATSTPDTRLRLSRFEPVTLGPGRRTAIRLQARSSDIGVHSVTLKVVDVDGRPLGSETRFSVRTSNVSTVIWVVMGIGGVLLLLAVAVRLYRRIRRRQATHGPLLARSGGDRSPHPGHKAKA
ncbi:MAG TPA: DUF6049 family protein [Nocardioidaceae bacterium]|nr:DUF6049 family protein [Nocardioidaceae bacterium]